MEASILNNPGQIKRGRGRPPKHQPSEDFVAIDLKPSAGTEPIGLRSVSFELIRASDGARMRVMVPFGDAAGFMQMFLGGGQ